MNIRLHVITVALISLLASSTPLNCMERGNQSGGLPQQQGTPFTRYAGYAGMAAMVAAGIVHALSDLGSASFKATAKKSFSVGCGMAMLLGVLNTFFETDSNQKQFSTGFAVIGAVGLVYLCLPELSSSNRG